MRRSQSRHGRGKYAVTALVAVAALGATVATSAAQAATAKLNTNATVTVDLGLAPTSLDIEGVAGAALDQALIGNVYQGLVNLNAQQQVVPALASSYTVSKSGLVWKFKLVQDAKFQDGTPLTSADVVWSYDQILNPKSTNPDASEFSSVSKVVADGKYGVTIDLKSRDSLFLFQLTDREGLVFKKGTDFAKTNDSANGTGPFTVKANPSFSVLTFTRVPDYWGTEPKVKKVIFDYITTPSTAVEAELKGQTDIENNTEATLLSSFKGKSDFSIFKASTSDDKFTLAFNNATGPTANLDVREAIRDAIDIPGLIKSQGGDGIAIGSFVPPGVPWYQNLTSIDSYNLSKAKSLLADAGYGSSNPLTLTLQVPNIYPATISEYVQADLAEAGITLNIDSEPFATWLTDVFEGQGSTPFQLSLVDQAESDDIGDYAIPTYYWGYNNTQVQTWYKDGLTANSDAVRNADFEDIARAISEQAVSDWLYLGDPIAVVHKGISGEPINNVNNRYEVANLTVAS